MMGKNSCVSFVQKNNQELRNQKIIFGLSFELKNVIVIVSMKHLVHRVNHDNTAVVALSIDVRFSGHG